MDDSQQGHQTYYCSKKSIEFRQYSRASKPTKGLPIATKKNKTALTKDDEWKAF